MCWAAEVFVWGRGEYGRLGLGDKSGSSKLRATQVTFKDPDVRIVQARLLSHIGPLDTLAMSVNRCWFLIVSYHGSMQKQGAGMLVSCSQSMRCLACDQHEHMHACIVSYAHEKSISMDHDDA